MPRACVTDIPIVSSSSSTSTMGSWRTLPRSLSGSRGPSPSRPEPELEYRSAHAVNESMYCSWRMKCSGESSMPCSQFTDLNVISSIILTYCSHRLCHESAAHVPPETEMAIGSGHGVLSWCSHPGCTCAIADDPGDGIASITGQRQTKCLPQQFTSVFFLKPAI